MNTAATTPAPSATTQAANLQALMAKFSEYDFAVVLDGSGSMGDPDKNNKSRWENMQESTVAFAREVTKIDSDGITACIFSANKLDIHDNVTGDKVKEMFAQYRPSGSTPMDKALKAILQAMSKSSKKKFITIFTDGIPDDQDALADVIRQQANSQVNDEQCTILFVQVGNDKSATQYLQQLDDNLSGVKFDIVDAKTIDQVDQFPSIVELIAHSIND